MNLILLFRMMIFLLGLALVVATVMSALRTLVLPRSVRDNLSRMVFRFTRKLFDIRLYRVSSFVKRDAIMALYAPLSLLILLLAWLILVTIGYMAMFWASGINSLNDAFVLSGSSLLTLGFATGDTFLHTILSFSESVLGLILVALLIGYLPTIYSAFSRRESAVKLLEVRAGAPPSAVEMFLRYHRIKWLYDMNSFWENWEVWFTEVEESHTSLAPLVFFRSPRSDQSWVTAAGTVLDAASLALSVLDVPEDPQAALCIRSGYLALREIATFFDIPHNPEPVYPDEPISITRTEFDAAYEELACAGIPLKANREQAWQDFAGWRVNYDAVLLALCSLTMAPEATWSSDRTQEAQAQKVGVAN
ncbi:MAG: hypothetical protein ACPGWR_10765 [Ardenticatenaceae bacterium]